MDDIRQFEKRKRHHIELALKPENQTTHLQQMDHIELIHEALPDLDFSEINLETKVFGQGLNAPLLISSMTAGHEDAPVLNSRLAKLCERRGWAMGVGSQRRELMDPSASSDWQRVRANAPNAVLFGNLGISQLILAKTSDVSRLIKALDAAAMIIHLNPLQECLQPEGTPRFRGGLKAIQKLAMELPIPIIVKETGCGISLSTMKRLRDAGVDVLDVSGSGGTHWGRIEGMRSPAEDPKAGAAQTYRDWGISTVETLKQARALGNDIDVWASGGVRTGLDAAKCIALGAQMVGFAQPALRAALESEESLDSWMQKIELELRIAHFCTGAKTPIELQGRFEFHER